MNIDDFIDWDGLSLELGVPLAELRRKVSKAVTPEPRVELPSSTHTSIKQAPRTIKQMSVNARNCFLKSTERVWAIEGEPDLPFDRVCVKPDGYVCFSSTRIAVAKTEIVTRHALQTLIGHWDNHTATQVPLHPTAFSQLPRELRAYRKPAYQQLEVSLASGQPDSLHYPSVLAAGTLTLDGLKWRRWSNVLGLHKSYQWTVAIDRRLNVKPEFPLTSISDNNSLTQPAPTYWTIHNKDQFVVQRLQTI